MTALSMKGSWKPPALPSLHLAFAEYANVDAVRLALVARTGAILRILFQGNKLVTSYAG